MLQYPSTPFPFKRVCESAIDRTIVDPRGCRGSQLPRCRAWRSFRIFVAAGERRLRQQRRPTCVEEREECTVVPYVLASLSLRLLALARLRGIDTLFMLIERRLARYFGIFMGIRPQIIGSPVEHRSARVPAMLRVPEVLDRLDLLVQPLFAAISADIRGAMPATNPLHHRVGSPSLHLLSFT